MAARDKKVDKKRKKADKAEQVMFGRLVGPAPRATKDFFKVERKKSAWGEIVTITITSDGLRNALYHITHEVKFSTMATKHRPSDFLPLMQIFESQFPEHPQIKPLAAFLREEFKATFEVVDAVREKGHVPFEFLWALFSPGQEVYGVGADGELRAGIIKKASYEAGWRGEFFQIDCQGTSYANDAFREDVNRYSIFAYDGDRNISDLPVRQLTPEVKETLVERGRRYVELVTGRAYRQYAGSLTRRTWFGSSKMRANGRVMIDLRTFKQFEPHYPGLMSRADDDLERGVGSEGCPEGRLFTLPGHVYGFSFAVKKWGELRVTDVSEIEFRTKAFDQLVLEPRRKQLIRALVEHSSESFTDIIEGKSGGIIFLLHGPPGCGKTLTAEAVADLLKRPLYSVSVGELGVDPDSLEESLRKILEVGQLWNAVMLIDEADIFLEERDQDNLVRNAMVGVFLRLLEYHQGVLFLTTNRVKRFDRAFHSRISLALHYPKLDDRRVQVWENLLHAARLDHLLPDVPELALHDVNGRQIKNIIRLSMGLAASEQTPVTRDHLLENIQFASDFERDVAGERLTEALQRGLSVGDTAEAA